VINHRRHCVAASLVLTIGLWGVSAAGQPAPASAGAAGSPAPVTIQPTTAYTNPGGAAEQAAIDNFCQLNVADLTNDARPDWQSKARENLSAATMQAGAPAAPAFMFAYGKSLNNAMLPKLAAAVKPTLRQRLNIAIVTAKVATAANNATLQEVTIRLINDPAEPVLLWALKAAQPQVPQVLGVKVGNAAPPLVAAIAPAVFKHPSGPVFDEAYKALNVVDVTTKTELLKLWGNRLQQYQGSSPPEDPDVDGKPVLTLSSAAMWSNVLNNPKAQADVMQMISDQLSVAAQWADQTPPGEVRDQLLTTVQLAASGVVVIGKNQNIPALMQAATSGSQIDPKRVSGTFKVVPVVKDIFPAVVAAFPGVKLPPTVGQKGGPGVAVQPQP
jgi:hypothetical protein